MHEKGRFRGEKQNWPRGELARREANAGGTSGASLGRHEIHRTADRADARPRCMSRKAQGQQVGAQLFPFLAVLICTMGALIVLLVLFVQQARVDASVLAAAKS